MARWALLLEYDGTRFVGWQYQISGPSIQSVLEEAVGRLAGGKVVCTAAGRTDSGVHASGQVVHVDLSREMTPEKMVAALNYHLKPHPVAVVCAAQVTEDFNARFSAIGRAYSLPHPQSPSTDRAARKASLARAAAARCRFHA